jgi:hypothetical protein
MERIIEGQSLGREVGGRAERVVTFEKCLKHLKMVNQVK